MACPCFLEAHALSILDAGKVQALLLHLPQSPEALVGSANAQASACMDAWSAWIQSQGVGSCLWRGWVDALHDSLQVSIASG